MIYNWKHQISALCIFGLDLFSIKYALEFYLLSQPGWCINVQFSAIFVSFIQMMQVGSSHIYP